MTVTTLTRPSAPTCCVDALLTEQTADGLRAAVYAEFQYGRGDAPGLDLGRALQYSRTGTVYRQEFEHGVTLANIGDEPVDFPLGRGYLDLDYVLCRYVVIPPRSAQVLFNCGRK